MVEQGDGEVVGGVMNYSWAVPAIISVVAFAWVALWPSRGDYFRGIEKVVFYPLAAIVSLLAWLLWALL